VLDGSGEGVGVPQRVSVGTGNNAVSGDTSDADSGGSGDTSDADSGGSGDGWGSGVSDSGDGGDTGVNVDGWGHGVVVGVLDNGLGPGHLDDVLSTDWDWDGHVVWLLDVDGGGDLDDLLDVLDDVIWDGVWLLNMDGLVDDVVLNGGVDDGSGDRLGSLKGSGHSDVDLGDHWLEDLGVVSGDVCLGAVVDLLGHLLGWLVDCAGGWGLDGGAVGGGHADGSVLVDGSNGGSGNDSWGSDRGDGWGSGDASVADGSWGSDSSDDTVSGDNASW